MLEAQAHALSVRNRLRAPANGHYSSELEILSPSALRKTRMFDQTRREQIERQARHKRALEMIAEYKRKLDNWVAQGIREPDIDGVPYVSLERILVAVCRHYGVRAIDIKSARRDGKVIRPRQAVMYLAREMTTLSLPQIGRRLGNRDHTTVLHGINRVTALIQTDIDFKEHVDAIRAALDQERPA